MKNIDNIEKYFRLIQNPQRYTGGELGSIKKTHSNRLKFALAFPEPYELGMSHLGFRIIYHIINKEYNLLAERVFCPAPDMMQLMRSKEIPLFSLESRTPIGEFDIVGFSLQSELSYSNILHMLDLSDIPFLRNERNESHPILIAGGPNVFNPEPLADIFDIFYIGDVEDNLPKILNVLHDNKDLPKKERLKLITKFDGLYIPEFYEPVVKDGILIGFDHDNDVPFPVKKHICYDLNKSNYQTSPIIPWTEVVHDRYALEIMRGCSRGCRFCLAGYAYRPVRERDCDELIDEANEALANSGLEEIGLLSLSTTDYSQIMDVMQNIHSVAKKRHVSMSIPSIRPEAYDDSLFEIIAAERKGGLTLAPEAGTPRLRAVINKKISTDDLYLSVDRAIKMGWKRIKLYFMIGLPTETDDDLLGIVSICEEIALRLKRVGGTLRVSISPFVPKPHTPFQWEPQITREDITRKGEFLFEELRSRRIRCNLDRRNPFTSFLEGLFSRGDRNIAKLLIKAWENGALFDGWDDLRNKDAWFKAIDELDFDTDRYSLHRDENAFLPWDIIHPGYPKDFLLREYKRAHKEKYTPNCRDIRCEKCSNCDFEKMIVNENVNTVINRKSSSGFGRGKKRIVRRDNFTKWSFTRVKYSRKGALKFLSHLDMGRLLRRAINRAELPVAYTQGYNVHQKLSFGPPLPVGYASDAEYVDIHLEQAVPLDSLQRLFSEFPDGMLVLESQNLSNAKKIQSLTAIVEYALFEIDLGGVDVGIIQTNLDDLMKKDEMIFERRTKSVDIKRFFKLFNIDGKRLNMLLQLSLSGAGRPEEYLQLTGMSLDEVMTLPITRKELLYERNGEYFDLFGNKKDLMI